MRHGITVYLRMSMSIIYERLRRNPEEIAKIPLLSHTNALMKLNGIYIHIHTYMTCIHDIDIHDIHYIHDIHDVHAYIDSHGF